jgi:cation diffusion facilitator CzcD-associated flavoprotein CzcO
VKWGKPLPPNDQKGLLLPFFSFTILTHNPQQAKLSILFLIVGGGISGLACAIALRRVGHRVIVLEQDGDSDEVSLKFTLSLLFTHFQIDIRWNSFSPKCDQDLNPLGTRERTTVDSSNIERCLRFDMYVSRFSYWDEGSLSFVHS